MDERNCGFCRPCAVGNYEQCENRKDDRVRDAAPELLDELQSLVRRLARTYPGFETTSARAAIAKARGE